MKMPPIEKGGPEVLHFYGSQESLDKLMKSDKGYDLSKTGLSEFCDAFVEEFEEELVNVMDTAKPATEALETPKGVAIPRFELKVDICVKATNMCDDEMLNRLSYHRIAQADPALMKDKMGELYDMLKAKGLTKDAEQKKDAGQKSKTIGEGGDQAPKVRPSGVDKATKPPKAESGNRAKNMKKQEGQLRSPSIAKLAPRSSAYSTVLCVSSSRRLSTSRLECWSLLSLPSISVGKSHAYGRRPCTTRSAAYARRCSVPRR